MIDSFLRSLTEEQKDRLILLFSPEVYFIRCGQFVKIGASKDPQTRLKQIRRMNGSLAFPAGLDLMASELIATELGSFERERELHKQFAHLRHTGEWFTEAPDLTEYIESLERNAA